MTLKQFTIPATLIALFVAWNSLSIAMLGIVWSICFMVLMCIFALCKNTQHSRRVFYVVRIFAASILVALIFALYYLVQNAGFDSMRCTNITGQNIFTKQVRDYCNVPAWYISR